LRLLTRSNYLTGQGPTTDIYSYDSHICLTAHLAAKQNVYAYWPKQGSRIRVYVKI